MGGENGESYGESKGVRETRELVSDLCRQFYTLGWVSGTGGSITIKVHDDSIPKSQQLIVMSPSGAPLQTLTTISFYLSTHLSDDGRSRSLLFRLRPPSLPSFLARIAGVQKERMAPEDMYVLSSNGSILSAPPPKPYPNKPPKCTDCAPLFMKVWEISSHQFHFCNFLMGYLFQILEFMIMICDEENK